MPRQLSRPAVRVVSIRAAAACAVAVDIRGDPRARAWFKNLLTIRGFLKLYSVDMTEAAESDPYRFGSFNEFFTRALQTGCTRAHRGGR
jgi:hypothetical protein